MYLALISSIYLALAGCVVLSTFIVFIGIRWIREINRMKKGDMKN